MDGTYPIKQISLAYDGTDPETSAKNLVYEVLPHWRKDPGTVTIHRCTGGVMNVLFKVTKIGLDPVEAGDDDNPVLVRAYGKGLDTLVDRNMEVTTHILLAERGLAMPLLARFENGLIYEYFCGRACSPQDLLKESIWRPVAARLGEWHARLPLPILKPGGDDRKELAVPPRTIWTAIQDWVAVLPSDSPEAEARKKVLQEELDKVVYELTINGSESYDNYVMGHCDLSSSNVIMPSQPPAEQPSDSNRIVCSSSINARQVHFIDYEFAVPCPPAFDLANHFCGWAGYDCDYTMLPSRTTRRAFIDEYMRSYKHYADMELSLDDLCQDVDRYRGLPGFVWGVQALIQKETSDTDFDWASYAEKRLAEFWAWRREQNGTRAQEGRLMPLRESRWAQEF